MKDLKFNSEYFLPILRENKIQTTRNNDKGIDTGEIINARFINKQTGGLYDYSIPIKITGIVQKRFKYLNNNDAFRENVSGVMQLRKDLKNIYPGLTEHQYIYCYIFRLVNLEEVE
jgi:hypothetical protein